MDVVINFLGVSVIMPGTNEVIPPSIKREHTAGILRDALDRAVSNLISEGAVLKNSTVILFMRKDGVDLDEMTYTPDCGKVGCFKVVKVSNWEYISDVKAVRIKEGDEREFIITRDWSADLYKRFDDLVDEYDKMDYWNTYENNPAKPINWVYDKHMANTRRKSIDQIINRQLASKGNYPNFIPKK